MVSVCTGLLGEEGRVSASVDTRLFNRIPLSGYVYTQGMNGVYSKHYCLQQPIAA